MIDFTGIEVGGDLGSSRTQHWAMFDCQIAAFGDTPEEALARLFFKLSM